MGSYAGAFAILTNKENPFYLFDSKNFLFEQIFDLDFIFANRSEIVQLVKYCYDQNSNISEHTFFLLDVKQLVFSIISFRCSAFYGLKEIDKNKFLIILDKPDDLKRFEERENTEVKNYSGIEVDSAKLIWTDIKQLNDYNNIYWNNRNIYRLN